MKKYLSLCIVLSAICTGSAFAGHLRQFANNAYITVDRHAPTQSGPNGGPNAVVHDANGNLYQVVLVPLTPSEVTSGIQNGWAIFGEFPNE